MVRMRDKVKVAQVREDQTPLKQVYNPTHPDANTEGYVFMPNVDITKEMVDMIALPVRTKLTLRRSMLRKR